MINLIKKKQNIQKIETITQPRALPLVIGGSIFHQKHFPFTKKCRKYLVVVKECLFADFFRVFELFENHLDNPKVRFMDCSDFSDSSDFAPTIISQCLDSSLMVPCFCYSVLVFGLDSSLEITFMLWPPCVTSEYSPAVGPALFSGVLQY